MQSNLKLIPNSIQRSRSNLGRDVIARKW